MLTLLFVKPGLAIDAGSGAAKSGRKWLLSVMTVAPASTASESADMARFPPSGVLGGLLASGTMRCAGGGVAATVPGVDPLSSKLDDMSTPANPAAAPGVDGGEDGNKGTRKGNRGPR